MRPIISRAVLASILATSAMAATNHGASASTTCGERATKQAFAAFGDMGEYFLTDSGSFESGTGAWSLSGGASVVADQSPWKVNGSSHGKALQLPAGAQATITMCVASNEDRARLFMKAAGSGTAIRVATRVATASGSGSTSMTYGTSSSGWESPPAAKFPQLREPNGQITITITITNSGSQAIVIDDVMVDPWVSR